jgi:hypothetical protein
LGFGKANASFKTFYDVWVGPPANQTLSSGKYDSLFLQCSINCQTMLRWSHVNFKQLLLRVNKLPCGGSVG